MNEIYQAIQNALEEDHSIGDVIPGAGGGLVVGNGGAHPGTYLLAHVGMDRFGRLWRQDCDGLTMVADFSANVKTKE